MNVTRLAFATVLSTGLFAGQVFAFSCPTLIKGTNEALARAEAAVGNISDDREKSRAMMMIELAKQWNNEAQADHKEAGAKKDAQLHYRSEAKAKAAKALADQVK
jgi:wobble nucleotide-excising tRNase